MHPLPAIAFRLAVPVAMSFFGISAPAQSSGQTIKVDCAEILKKMREDIAVDPGRLVLAMEDALTTSEVCACPIVRTAVDLAGREPALTCRILIAAIHQLPASSAQITECVLLEAPEAAPAIRTALAKELGEKSPELLETTGQDRSESAAPLQESGKSPVGKQPAPVPPAIAMDESVATEEEELDFYPSIGVSGVYLIPPRSGSAVGGSVTHIPKIYETIIKTTKSPPKRPVLSVTRSIPE